MADVVRAALAASVRRLIENEPGVRLGEDPEAVHQARVAVRRLRSDLKTFGSWLDAAWADALRGDLKAIADRLGAVRDAEVLIDRLRRRVDELPESDRGAGTDLVAKLGQARDGYRNELLAAMHDGGYLALLDRLVAAAREPRVLPDASTVAASDASAVMQSPWRRLEEAVDGIGHHPSDAELHAVRIRTKRVRYAAEALIPVKGKAARRFAERAADLQDVLGEHQDGVVAQSWLRQAAGRGRRASFVAGELTAAERLAAEAAASSWPAAWDRLERKRARFW
jgi:CHAD domain-containing protein